MSNSFIAIDYHFPPLSIPPFSTPSINTYPILPPLQVLPFDVLRRQLMTMAPGPEVFLTFRNEFARSLAVFRSVVVVSGCVGACVFFIYLLKFVSRLSSSVCKDNVSHTQKWRQSKTNLNSFCAFLVANNRSDPICLPLRRHNDFLFARQYGWIPSGDWRPPPRQVRGVVSWL